MTPRSLLALAATAVILGALFAMRKLGTPEPAPPPAPAPRVTFPPPRVGPVAAARPQFKGSTPAPAGPPPAVADPALREKVQRVEDLLKERPTAEACLSAKADLVALLGGLPETAPLWSWAFAKAGSCEGAFSDRADAEHYVADLQAARPQNPKLLFALARAEWANFNNAAAVVHLKQALEQDNSPQMLDFLAFVQEGQADVARLERKDSPEWRALLQEARDTQAAAIDQMGPDVNLWALSRMSELDARLGNLDSAVDWENRTVDGIQVSDAWAAYFYRRAADVYYRAGRQERWLYCMDQAVRLAQNPEEARGNADDRRAMIDGSYAPP